MAYSIRKQFHSSIANTVLTDIQFHRDSYYYFLGKLTPWGTLDEPSDTPPALTSAVDMDVRNGIAFFKQITANDVSLMVSRNDWVSGTVYSQWDDTVDMEELPFFVLTSNNQVFKCLFNNHGAASTSMPNIASYSPLVTADGYIWKYMYSIPEFKHNKFSNETLIPVQTTLSDGFYDPGAVDAIAISDSGSGYTDSLLTYITVSAASGSGAILVPKISADTGSIIGVTIVNGGTGYDPLALPLVEVQVLAGQTPGTNLYPENISIGTAILSPVVSEGVIKSVSIIDPGIDYPHENTTVISVVGDGTGMILRPVVYAGMLVDAIIDAAGTGYTFANITVSGVGSGASVYAIFASSDLVSDQNVVEQSAISGAIYAANVITPGTGYTNTTTVSITGDGTGATATATVSGGSITAIDITSYGYGYTYANIAFSDVNRIGTFIDATAYAILPPIGGHGAMAIRELYGRILAAVSSVRVSTIVPNSEQDWHQYGLIKKPRNLYSNTVATVGVDTATYEVVFDTVSNLALDQTLLLDGKYPYTVSFISGNNVFLQANHTAQIDPIGNLANGPNAYVSTSVVTRPTINKYSGDLLFVSNELPFLFSESQGLTIKTYITF